MTKSTPEQAMETLHAVKAGLLPHVSTVGITATDEMAGLSGPLYKTEEKYSGSQPPMHFNPWSGYTIGDDQSRAVEHYRRPTSPKWDFNPWTGTQRNLGDVQSDPHGLLIWEPNWGPMRAAQIKPSEMFKPLSVEDDPIISANDNPAYGSLASVLSRAYEQASRGKGKDRHQQGAGQHFDDQPICTISRTLGSIDGNLFQATKKCEEARRLPKDKAVAELLGAINYLAAAVILVEEGILEP